MDEVTPLSRIAGRFDLLGAGLGECEVGDGFLLCPVCGAPIQRIVHAENQSNYCARCQTGGRVLADRSLSKLLKETWPRRIEELEETDAGSSR